MQPALQEAIAAGQHGRIGFAAFTWSLDGSFNLLVPWTMIDLPAAAKAVAARFERAVPRPILGSAQAPTRSWRQGLGTDLSAAIAQSTRLMAKAPFQAGREVINICANGTDNVFEGPALVRDQALAAGLVVNGLIIGDQPEVEEYCLNRVQGGPGSFVLKILDYADVTQAMLTKFVLDIAWRQKLAAPSAKPG